MRTLQEPPDPAPRRHRCVNAGSAERCNEQSCVRITEERANERRMGGRKDDDARRLHCQSLNLTRTKIRPRDDADFSAPAPDHFTYVSSRKRRGEENEEGK